MLRCRIEAWNDVLAAFSLETPWKEAICAAKRLALARPRADAQASRRHGALRRWLQLAGPWQAQWAIMHGTSITCQDMPMWIGVHPLAQAMLGRLSVQVFTERSG